MEIAPAMALALDASFGSVERWRQDFVTLAAGCSAGAVLAFSPADARLVNQCRVDTAAPPPDGVRGGIDGWQSAGRALEPTEAKP